MPLNLIASLSFLCFAMSCDQSNAMTFQKSGNGGNCFVGCEYIIASGEITEQSGAEFNAYLDSISPRVPQLVIIDSLGGNLFGGLELGRAFRAHSLAVYVGKVIDMGSGEVTDAGVCYSACAYAILGGVQRGVYDFQTHVGNPLSQIGFHQFFYSIPEMDDDITRLGQELKMSQEQIVSGFLASYLAEMGVDARVLLLASSKSGNDIYVPTQIEMQELGITKDITSPFSNFDLEIYNNNILLFSKRRFPDNLNQISQVTFLCQGGFVSILVTGENTAASGSFLNVDRKFNSSSYYPSFMKVSVDGNAFRVDAADVSEHFSTDGLFHYATVQLGVPFVQRLATADVLEIRYEIARAAGNYDARIAIDQAAKDGLTYLSKVCATTH